MSVNIKELCDVTIKKSREKQTKFRKDMMDFVESNGNEADTEELYNFSVKRMEEDEDFKAILLIGAVNLVLQEMEDSKEQDPMERIIRQALKNNDNGEDFAKEVLEKVILSTEEDGGTDESGSGITH